ncbi:lytic transglycosylase domain-containing protein [Bacillus sp. NP157]|nr:lytic transglycosylase domain-containing protein [Bacillus sp. NP157]
MMGCQNLAVPAEVMQHVVNVESSHNPYAIGVVGGQLVRQPQNLGEAVATVRMLETKGYNYSLGVAQVNRSNLGKYGLDTYEKAFDLCPNLRAGSQILAQCYASASGDWGKAFSCYYSGNFTTGYQDGYVQKIFDSMARAAGAASVTPIPIEVIKTGAVAVAKAAPTTPSEGMARVAMRSVGDAALAAAIDSKVSRVAAIDPQQQQPFVVPGTLSNDDLRMLNDAQTQADMQQARGAAGQSAVGAGTPQLSPQQMQQWQQMQQSQMQGVPDAPPGKIPTDPGTAAIMSQIGPQLPNVPAVQPGRIPTDPTTAALMSQVGVSAPLPQAQAQGGQMNNGVFEPQVRGPNDPVPTTGVPQPQAPTRPAVDNADLRNGGGDGAFVF